MSKPCLLALIPTKMMIKVRRETQLATIEKHLPNLAGVLVKTFLRIKYT